MRRSAVLLTLTFTLAACGGAGDGEVPRPPLTTTSLPPEPGFPRADTITLSCGDSEVRVPATPADGLTPAGRFARLDALRRPLKVSGRIWSDNDERMYVGVVCGAQTPEQFATLVAKATLTSYRGKPALHWTTRTGVRSFMWLERPGTAVYIGATPGLTGELRSFADAIGE
jgi:hypothetical protein